MIQVVTFTCTFTNTGEHRETIVSFGNIIDKLHDQHGLTDTCTTEQTDLTTLAVRFKEVNHLNTGIQNLCADRKIIERRCRLMDRTEIIAVKSRETVNCITDNVKKTTLHLRTGGNSDRTFKIIHSDTSLQAISTFHSHTTHRILSDMLLNLEDQH
jgi:hypothetical protein